MELIKFIIEREKVRINKEVKKLPPPWTKDPILQQYRFCNVHREDDRVTRWIASNWRNPNSADPDLWFAMAVARLVNWPPTLAAIGYPVPWDVASATKAVNLLKSNGDKVFTSAYIVSTNGVKSDKWEYVSKEILNTMWAFRGELRPYDSLEYFYNKLRQVKGMGSFLAAQIVADMKYVEPLLHSADDWWTFAASGPGSRRGLSRVTGRVVDSPWKEWEWHMTLITLLNEVNKELKRSPVSRLHAQDLQNCLCEYDKYMRVKLGEGRPRQNYKPETRF